MKALFTQILPLARRMPSSLVGLPGIDVKRRSEKLLARLTRMNSRTLVACVCGLLLSLALVQNANAQLHRKANASGHHETRAADRVHHATPGEAAQRAQHLNDGGRVLSVEHRHDGYRVKLIKHGEIRIVFVPGK